MDELQEDDPLGAMRLLGPGEAEDATATLVELRSIAMWQASSIGQHSGRAAFAVCLGALVAAGCAASSRSSTRTTTKGRESVDTLEGRPQAGTLRLGSGRSSAHYTITALSPPTHTYDVHLDTAAAADVSVRIQTWYGQSLGVLDSTRREPHRCKVTAGRTACRLLFPGLEAQRAGAWTVIASKQLGAPASVHLSVTFAAIAPRRTSVGR